MAKANLVQKRIRMSRRDIIKYQLLSHSFINSISYSDAELNCLTLLGVCGETDLSEFCNFTVDENIFKVSQTARNFLTKAEKINLIEKNGTSKKKVKLKDDLQIQTSGNIVLDYKIVYLDTQES
jgi:hypothetical protein